MIKIITILLILFGVTEISFAYNYKQNPITNKTPRKTASFSDSVRNQIHAVGLWSNLKSPLPGDIEIHRSGSANIGKIVSVQAGSRLPLLVEIGF